MTACLHTGSKCLLEATNPKLDSHMARAIQPFLHGAITLLHSFIRPPYNLTRLALGCAFDTTRDTDLSGQGPRKITSFFAQPAASQGCPAVSKASPDGAGTASPSLPKQHVLSTAVYGEQPPAEVDALKAREHNGIDHLRSGLRQPSQLEHGSHNHRVADKPTANTMPQRHQPPPTGSAREGTATPWTPPPRAQSHSGFCQFSRPCPGSRETTDSDPSTSVRATELTGPAVPGEGHKGLLAHQDATHNGSTELHEHDSCDAGGQGTDDVQHRRASASTGADDSAACLLSQAYDAGLEGSADDTSGLTAGPCKQPPADTAIAAVNSGVCPYGASDRPSGEAAILPGVAAAEDAPASTNAAASRLRPQSLVAEDRAPAQVLKARQAAVSPVLSHLSDSSQLHAAPAAASTGMQAGGNLRQPDATLSAHGSEVDGMNTQPAAHSAEVHAASGPAHRSSATPSQANVTMAEAPQARPATVGSGRHVTEPQASGGVRVNEELLRLRSLYTGGGSGNCRAGPALSRDSSQEARDLALASRLQQEECRRAGPGHPGHPGRPSQVKHPVLDLIKSASRVCGPSIALFAAHAPAFAQISDFVILSAAPMVDWTWGMCSKQCNPTHAAIDS